jgi:hypothetical protein
MAEPTPSTIKIEVTGEAATALAKLPELVRDIIADAAHRSEMQELRLREDRMEEREEQDRLEKRAADADERRQQHIVSVLGIAAELVKSYLSGKEEGDEPAGQESASDAILAHLRNDLCRLVPRTTLPTTLPLDQVLQMLKYARPEWLPEDVVGRMYAVMRYCTDLRDAGDLLDALGEDTRVHREAIRVLDGAFDLYEKRKDPGFMCMDCGARQVDPKTHHKECKEHKECLEPGHAGAKVIYPRSLDELKDMLNLPPVSDADFMTAVCVVADLNVSGSLHLIECLDLALDRLNKVTDPGTWDYTALADALSKIDRYMSGTISTRIGVMLADKKYAKALRVLNYAGWRRRKLAAGEPVWGDLGFDDQEFISAVCRLAPAPGNFHDTLEWSLRSLSTEPPDTPFVDPEYPDNLNRIALYLQNGERYLDMIHPTIKELLERPEFQVAYERLKGIAKQSPPEQESV